MRFQPWETSSLRVIELVLKPVVVLDKKCNVPSGKNVVFKWNQPWNRSLRYYLQFRLLIDFTPFFTIPFHGFLFYRINCPRCFFLIHQLLRFRSFCDDSTIKSAEQGFGKKRYHRRGIKHTRHVAIRSTHVPLGPCRKKRDLSRRYGTPRY